LHRNLISIIGVRFNIDGAFLGKLNEDANLECGTGALNYAEEGPGKGALPFYYFLAVPIVRIDERHQEERYVPASGVVDMDVDIKEEFNSFIHFAYEASHRHYVFTDLQGLHSYLWFGMLLIYILRRKPTGRRDYLD
jgi:hypothetical protein